MTDFDFERQVVRELLQLVFPKSTAWPIAAAAVSRDENSSHLSSLVSPTAQAAPPLADRGDGELGRVMADANVHPGFILFNVIDTIGNRFPFFLVGEVVRLDLRGLSFSLPSLSGVLVIPDDFLFFRVDGDGGLPRPLLRLDTPTNVLKLRITVRMLLALNSLAVRLQTVTGLFEQLGYRRGTGRVPSLFQLLGQFSGALARPLQWRLWITSCRRLDQAFQGTQQMGICFFEVLTASTGSTLLTFRWIISLPKLSNAVADCTI